MTQYLDADVKLFEAMVGRFTRVRDLASVEREVRKSLSLTLDANRPRGLIGIAVHGFRSGGMGHTFAEAPWEGVQSIGDVVPTCECTVPPAVLEKLVQSNRSHRAAAMLRYYETNTRVHPLLLVERLMESAKMADYLGQIYGDRFELWVGTNADGALSIAEITETMV